MRCNVAPPLQKRTRRILVTPRAGGCVNLHLDTPWESHSVRPQMRLYEVNKQQARQMSTPSMFIRFLLLSFASLWFHVYDRCMLRQNRPSPSPAAFLPAAHPSAPAPPSSRSSIPCSSCPVQAAPRHCHAPTAPARASSSHGVDAPHDRDRVRGPFCIHYPASLGQASATSAPS